MLILRCIYPKIFNYSFNATQETVIKNILRYYYDSAAIKRCNDQTAWINSAIRWFLFYIWTAPPPPPRQHQRQSSNTAQYGSTQIHITVDRQTRSAKFNIKVLRGDKGSAVNGEGTVKDNTKEWDFLCICLRGISLPKFLYTSKGRHI